MTATLDAAIWGAELALGEEPGRIYLVEPTGVFEDDPNLTDKKFSRNPTRSYRTKQPMRIHGEILEWEGHPEDMLKKMRDHLEELKRQGIVNAIVNRFSSSWGQKCMQCTQCF